jgi:hypothetical protein
VGTVQVNLTFCVENEKRNVSFLQLPEVHHLEAAFDDPSVGPGKPFFPNLVRCRTVNIF